MLKRTIASLLFIAFLGGLVLSVERPAAGPEDRAADGAPSAAAAAKLKEASALRRTSFKKPNDEKKRILLETAGVYERIIEEYRTCRPECAEASFRAGEIYRSLKMADRAEASFLRTLDFQAAGEFAARSLNEVGHIYRRKVDFGRAIEFYRRVLDECADVRDECADAVTWIGKVQLKMNELEKGRQTLLGFADRFPEFPVIAIRNMDLVALSLIDEGRLNEAESLVESCIQRYDVRNGEDGALDKKVEKALKKMKAVEKLEARRTSKAGKADAGSVGD
jgi:tetratricopeptide (TPR) repeat protein